MGGGIATLYFSVYAAHHTHGLIGMYPAFALMAFITVCSGVMAVGFNSMLVAVLGILGGYGTPIMLHTGTVDFVGLFTYLLLLGCGVLGISLPQELASAELSELRRHVRPVLRRDAVLRA